MEDLIGREMLQRAARTAREKRDSLMPKRGNKPTVPWEDLEPEVRNRWLEAMRAVREELNLDSHWRPR